MTRSDSLAVRLVFITLVAVAASAVQAQTWQKGPEEPLTSPPLRKQLNAVTIQNTTGQTFTFAAQLYKTDLQRDVTGSTNDGPPWPDWLKPLQHNPQPVSIVYPYGTYDPCHLSPGETYKFIVTYDYETGSQIWSKPPGGGQGPQTAKRNRYWNTYVDKSQTVD